MYTEKFIKKVLLKISSAVVIAAIILQAIIHASALTIYIGDFGYNIDSDTLEATITDYIGGGSDVFIPESIYSYPIVNVKRSAFDSPEEMTLWFYSESPAYEAALAQNLNCAVLRVGDANLDGTVNIIDATMIQRIIADLISPTPQQKLTSDADRNGTINISDVTAVQKYVAKLIPSL